MTALPDAFDRLTEAEYLVFERTSDIKHEFIDGDVIAMTGASEAHNLITGSTYFVLYGQLRKRLCKVYLSDMKVRTPSTGSYVYPDITVVCDDPLFEDAQHEILLNPTVVIEVLSPNTEGYDRGKKFERYREIASLQEYILISQDRPHIERFVRQQHGWHFSDAHGLQASLNLTSIACALSLAEVYEQVDFDDNDAEPSKPE